MAVNDEGEDERPVELLCSAGIAPYQVACGQGEATLQLDATGTGCVEEDSQASSSELCPDLRLTWRTSCPGLDGNDPILSEQGIFNPTLTIGTADADGSAIPPCGVTLIAVAPSHNLKVICHAPVEVGECIVDCRGDVGGSAVIDECGVCQGDGRTCLVCEESNIQESQLVLDGVSRDQAELVKQIVGRLRKFSGNSNAYSKQLKLAQDASIAGWTTIWSIDSIQHSNCSSSTLCVQSDNSGSIEDYRASQSKLHKVTLKLAKKVKPFSTKLYKRYIEKDKLLLLKGESQLENIPISNQECN